MEERVRKIPRKQHSIDSARGNAVEGWSNQPEKVEPITFRLWLWQIPLIDLGLFAAIVPQARVNARIIGLVAPAFHRGATGTPERNGCTERT